METSPEEVWRYIFKPDSGTLQNIRVYEINSSDYEKLLSMLVSDYSARYIKDTVEQEHVPDYQTILSDCYQVSVLVRFYVAGAMVHLWFWGEEEIDLDLLPEDIDSSEKAEGIFRLMKAISLLLNKRVLLTTENASATQEWSEEYAICSINPADDQVRYHGI